MAGPTTCAECGAKVFSDGGGHYSTCAILSRKIFQDEERADFIAHNFDWTEADWADALNPNEGNK